MVDWYVYGAGGHGAETMDILRHMLQVSGRRDVALSFIDDFKPENNIVGLPVISILDAVPTSLVSIGVGEPNLRADLLMKATKANLRPTTIVSPLAFVSEHAVVEDGCTIAPFSSIQARAHLHRNVSINTGATVTHDVILNQDCCVSISANIAGAARVGERTYIGMGAHIKQGISIGKSTVVGMGAVVTKDVPDEAICFGNPAKIKSRRSEKVF